MQAWLCTAWKPGCDSSRSGLKRCAGCSRQRMWARPYSRRAFETQYLLPCRGCPSAGQSIASRVKDSEGQFSGRLLAYMKATATGDRRSKMFRMPIRVHNDSHACAGCIRSPSSPPTCGRPVVTDHACSSGKSMPAPGPGLKRWRGSRERPCPRLVDRFLSAANGHRPTGAFKHPLPNS